MTLNTLPLPDLATTERLAARLAPLLRRGDALALKGELGAGKTAFARGLIRSLCIQQEDVPSPTFTLLQTYDAPHFAIYHFDLYRLENGTELRELGWDDALADGVTIVEWPERAGSRLPATALTLHFDLKDGVRSLRIETNGDWAERLRDLHI